MRQLYFPQNPEEINQLLRIAKDWLSDLEGWSHHNAYAAAVIYQNRTVAVVIYCNQSHGNLEMHIASRSPAWCSRAILKKIFFYPFSYLGVRRVSALTKASNHDAQKMLQRLGFQWEGHCRQYYGPKDDAIAWGLLRDECRWWQPLEPKYLIHSTIQ